MRSAPTEDLRLVERARRGDRDAAGALVARHLPRARVVAVGITGDRSLGDDVVQDAFVAALGALDQYDPSRGTFGAWMNRIVVNRAISMVRRPHREVALGEDDHLADPPEEDAAGFLAALQGLADEHRAVLVLRYGLDLTPPEIADTLGIALGTVHSRLARGLAALRQTMESRHDR